MRYALLIGVACIAGWGAYTLWQHPDAPSAGLQATGPAAGAGKSEIHKSLLASVPPQASGLPTPLASPLAWPASSAAQPVAAAGLPAAAAQTPAASAATDPTPPPLSAADKAANDALRQLGYFIDERYYKMGLDALRRAAAAQDVQALTHLAERYMFEFDGHPQAQGYEPGFAYLQAAREALQAAYVLGNRHAAAMLSESYLMQRQTVDAAAWNLVAQRSGDKLSADWFLTTEDYRRLTDMQRNQAAQAADRLWAALQARKPAGT
ncbi:hypothetical protein ACS5PN_13245 [Roseateles sp. NT4]|uniref:hypothetical protein n=1 Tax=Roseateles sp. NT4 TaxID=3453715 RepID=UPI003EEBEB1E